jgi:8-oxo-dGTP pyrophosphatase MutT (NUDIX family)
MCRLESFEAGERLRLRVSRTSYKPFLGTNLTHPEFADRHGPGALANPIGLSAALETSDGVLMLGRRSASLAYYPGRVHPFAGALEPRETVDIFADMNRELQVELGLVEGEVREMSVVGLVEDLALRQPEVVFYVRCEKTQSEIEQQLDVEEHTGSVAVKGGRVEVEGWLANPALTPVACAALLLWGRGKWGAEWFDAAGRAVTLRG